MEYNFTMRKGKIFLGENCFEVEIAETIFEKVKGLGGRKSLGKNSGMLFVFSMSSIHPFTMKNTLIPFDIIWLDKNYKVVDIKENNKPCISFLCPPIIPRKLSKYVLEINGGLCEKLGIKVKDAAKIEVPSEARSQPSPADTG